MKLCFLLIALSLGFMLSGTQAATASRTQDLSRRFHHHHHHHHHRLYHAHIIRGY
jgi:hypothetical protein